MAEGDKRNIQSVNSIDDYGLVAKSIAEPRVGGKRGKVFWTGGSNVNLTVRLKSSCSLRARIARISSFENQS